MLCVTCSSQHALALFTSETLLSALLSCGWGCSLFSMLPVELTQTVLELPVEDRLELARRLVESVVLPAMLNEAVTEGIRRIEDVAAGRTAGLTEEQFRSALQ
jgi:putative addiction module component (TIGR02574 family)